MRPEVFERGPTILAPVFSLPCNNYLTQERLLVMNSLSGFCERETGTIINFRMEPLSFRKEGLSIQPNGCEETFGKQCAPPIVFANFRSLVASKQLGKISLVFFFCYVQERVVKYLGKVLLPWVLLRTLALGTELRAASEEKSWKMLDTPLSLRKTSLTATMLPTFYLYFEAYFSRVLSH